MGADNTISYITGSFAAMGVLAFFVAVIVQTVKELPVLKKLPTSAVALGVSLILCPLSLLAFCAYAGESVTWYFICASVLAAFPVYLVATGGWERLRDIWERTKYKDRESTAAEKKYVAKATRHRRRILLAGFSACGGSL